MLQLEALCPIVLNGIQIQNMTLPWDYFCYLRLNSVQLENSVLFRSLESERFYKYF